MFKRKIPLSFTQKLKQLCWPSMGWGRLGCYVKQRAIRIPDTTHKIALGAALGACLSFSPFIFTHILQGLIFAFFLRANYIAVVIGTIIGNPWTFPFMWWAGIGLGAALFETLGFPASTNLPDTVTISVFIDLIKNDPYRILAPWAVGGYLIALLSFPLFYGMFYFLVKGAKLTRLRVIKKAKQERQQ